jgi:hypothetical protein
MPGQSFDLELADSADYQLADGPRIRAKKEAIPLTNQWQEHSLDFEIRTPFKDQTYLRFRLPGNVKGTFDLTDTRLKAVK